MLLTDLQADEQFLRQLKEFKDRVQLSDEAAAEVFQEAARTKLERCLDTALEAIKKRTRVRDYTPAVKVRLSDIASTSVPCCSCDRRCT